MSQQSKRSRYTLENTAGNLVVILTALSLASPELPGKGYREVRCKIEHYVSHFLKDLAQRFAKRRRRTCLSHYRVFI